MLTDSFIGPIRTNKESTSKYFPLGEIAICTFFRPAEIDLCLVGTERLGLLVIHVRKIRDKDKRFRDTY